MNPVLFENKALNYKGKIIFSKIVIGGFDRILKNFQEDEACFMFIDDGGFLMRTPKEIIRFESGDGLLAKCGNYYFEQNIKKESSKKTTTLIAAYFYPSIIKDLFDEDFKVSSYQTSYDVNKIKIDKLLLNFKANISFLLDNSEIADESLTLTKLKEFLILLSKTEKAPDVIDFISSLFKPIENKFKSIIKTHLFSSLSLQEFATLCNMSLATFNRKFQEIYAENPRKYITNKKIEKASELLTSKENRIVDIAYGCGFESISTFNRNFKIRYKKSPTGYRNTIIDTK